MNRLLQYDDEIRRMHGVELVGGVDEAGRGALAGPVVAAAVVLAPGRDLEGVNDSKQLAPEERERLAPVIAASCAAFGIGMATAAEIDRLNILQATHLAASRALATLESSPGHLVTDFLKLKNAPCGLTAITKGDSTSLAVAAASVLAKVARDRIMTLLDAEYPDYLLARHKGYGTEEHLALLRTHGPSAAHRLSFRGVCWFDAAPAVRCASAAAGRLGAESPRADLAALAGEGWRAVPAQAFLPEWEFRAARGDARIVRESAPADPGRRRR